MADKRPLDGIFFDIDDTLFSTTVFADKARRAAMDAMLGAGLRSDRETCLRELDEVLREFSSNYSGHFDKIMQRLPEAATSGLNPAVVVAAGVVAYHETKWQQLKVYDDAYELLKWLSGTSLTRGVISAGITVKQAEKVIRLKILDFITPTAIFFTDQIGFAKPNPKLYRRVANRVQLEPSRMMYVGDNPTHDIDPANHEGWITCRVRKSGRYAHEEGATKADYEVTEFAQLRRILEAEFELAS